MIIASKAAVAGSAGAPQEYWDMVLADDAKSLYKMLENTGSTLEDSGPNGLDVTLYNTPTLDQAGPSVYIPKAVLFDSASSEYGETAESALLNLNSTSAWSVETWMKYTTNGTSLQAIMTVRGTGLTSSLMILNVNNGLAGRIQALTYDSTSSFLSINSDGGWNDGNWHHVVVTAVSAGAMKLYVDGVERASTNTARISNTSSRRIYLASNTTAQYFNGTLAASAFYTDTLSAAEVDDHYQQGI